MCGSGCASLLLSFSSDASSHRSVGQEDVQYYCSIGYMERSRQPPETRLLFALAEHDTKSTDDQPRQVDRNIQRILLQR